MVKGMGESCFEDLLPWLMETLTYEQSSVDRSGAAQGLAEVMAGLGVEKLEKLMPEIVATASKVDIAPHVRDGYIMMFNYLPITFGDKFTPYVGPIIPCILKVGTDDHAVESVTEKGRARARSPLLWLGNRVRSGCLGEAALADPRPSVCAGSR